MDHTINFAEEAWKRNHKKDEQPEPVKVFDEIMESLDHGEEQKIYENFERLEKKKQKPVAALMTQVQALQEVSVNVRQSENITAEMERAYDEVRGENASKKSRSMRRESTTIKKQERAKNLRAGMMRSENNSNYMLQQYDNDFKALKKNTWFKSDEQRQLLQYWLKTEGTSDESAEEIADRNHRFISAFTKPNRGMFTLTDKVMDMFQDEIDTWNLEEYSRLDDETISRNYYELNNKVKKVEAAGMLLDMILSSKEEKDRQEIERFKENCDVEKMQQKVAFFKDLGQVLEAKAKLIQNPYYALLRKRDIENINDIQVKYDAIADKTTDLASYYHALLSLNQLRDARKRLENPNGYESWLQEQERQQQERLEREQQEKQRKEEEWERELQAAAEENWVSDREENQIDLKYYKKMYEDSKLTAEEQIKFQEKWRNLPELYIPLRAWLNDSPEQTKRIREVFTRSIKDTNGKRDWILDRLKEVNEMELPTAEQLTDEQISGQCGSIMKQIEKVESGIPLLKLYLYTTGTECDDEMKKQLVARKRYFAIVKQYVSARMKLMQNSHYIVREDNDLSEEELRSRIEKLGTDRKEEKMYYQVELALRTNEDLKWLKDPAGFMEQALSDENLLGESLDDRLELNINRLFSTYYSNALMAKEVKESKNKDDVYQPEKELQNQQIIWRYVRIKEMFDAIKLKFGADEYAAGVAMLYEKIDSTEEYQDCEKAFLAYPKMSDREIKERAKNLHSEDRTIRHAEYKKIFDLIRNTNPKNFNGIAEKNKDEYGVQSETGLLKEGSSLFQYANAWKHFPEILLKAVQDGVDIRPEEKQTLWKKAEFFSKVAEQIQMRYRIMISEDNIDFPVNRVPQTVAEAEALMNEEEKSPIRVRMYEYLKEKENSGIDTEQPLDEQFRKYTASPIPDEYLTPAEKEKNSRS